MILMLVLGEDLEDKLPGPPKRGQSPAPPGTLKQ